MPTTFTRTTIQTMHSLFLMHIFFYKNWKNKRRNFLNTQNVRLFLNKERVIFMNFFWYFNGRLNSQTSHCMNLPSIFANVCSTLPVLSSRFNCTFFYLSYSFAHLADFLLTSNQYECIDCVSSMCFCVYVWHFNSSGSWKFCLTCLFITLWNDAIHIRFIIVSDHTR